MKSFKLKGNRNYLRGADIYRYFIKKNFKDIKIEFKKRIKYIPILTNYSKVKNKNRISSIVEFKKNSKISRICLIDSKKKITEKESYSENIIYKYFKLNKNGASCNFKTKFSAIDVVVALNKIFHNKKIKQNEWYLAKLELKQALSDNPLKKYTLKLKSNTLNKLTTIHLFENKKKIGKIITCGE